MEFRRTGKWSRRKLIGFSVITILVFFFILEGLFRVFFYFRYRHLHTSVFIQGSPMQENDAVTVYDNRAFFVDYEKRFQFNEWGMTCAVGDIKMPEKKKNSLWVLLLGGSAMQGMGSNKDGKWFDITNIRDHPYRENIANYLEQKLKSKFPSLDVRVFNAAVSGFTLQQGYAKYKLLSSKFHFDWVISMDGVNEADTINGNEPEFYDSKKYWSTFPFHRFPMNFIVKLTQHSALFNTLKQEFFYIKLKGRMVKNSSGDFPELKYWANQPLDSFKFLPDDIRVQKAVNLFLTRVLNFEKLTMTNGSNFVFFVQPFLPFRHTGVMTVEEKALVHYFSHDYRDDYKFTFMKKLRDTVGQISKSDPHFQEMSKIDSCNGWMLVDYCHLTKQANEIIANELADYITGAGKAGMFMKR